MKDFKELDKRTSYEVEQDILNKWENEEILDLSIKNRKNNDNFVFYDGPATANGMPGIHHMMGKILKDTFCKYKTMQGYKVLRKVGWDTHGLPVEVQVEKELGFNGKSDIEKYGVEPFNKKCRELVWKNEEAFTRLTKEMGQFIDTKHPYVTYNNDYIETEWWILKKFFDEGLFYEGFKVTPYCPRCGTSLASHEVAQGYKDITTETVIVPMKKVDEDVYFLVWTTTPWTLLSNVALCVNPNATYVKAESEGYKFILAETLATAVLGDDYKVLETYKGKELEYTKYEQLIPEIKIDGEAFFVTCDDYVTMEDGTGIVHLAPAFGEDDSKVGRKYKLPYVNPVGLDGKYTEGPWKNMLVFDADLEVIKYLKENDKLFKKQKVVHNYPHCWRCKHPLLYYSMPSYYLEVTKLKNKIIQNNNKVNWYPSYIGEKRFGNWLENMNDWAISRSRYWGTPLPLWTCDCGHKKMIGSRKELSELAIEEVDETKIDLHRPYVDDVHIVCEKCGNQMTRVKDVIDCWFDSGSMPFAQYHYPFENKELWKSQFPADFISEGIDQTRGWFYSLLVISTFVTGKSPYKNVLVNDLLLDDKGQKMHKSRGNVIEPFAKMREFSADIVRFHLIYASPVWTPISVSNEGMKEVFSKYINPFKNTYSFFEMYANTDDIDIDKCDVAYEDREEIDKWLLSKYNKLLKNVTEGYEEYDLSKVARPITQFISEDLSNWYIRRNRNRFWSSTLDNSKKSVYLTTYEVLCGLCKILAPITPYITEEMYTKLTGEKSVHLTDFPKYNENYINDNIEIKMDLVRDLISIGRNVREETKIKVRQPISEILLDGKNESIISNLKDLIKEELNVKTLTFVKDLSEYMNFTIKPNFKEVGKIFGSNIKEYQTKLLELSELDKTKLQNDETIKMIINDTESDITPNMVDIRIEAKEGFNVGTFNNEFVILNTTLTKELLDEGLARETISKIQQLRKTMNFDIVDRIKVFYKSSNEYSNSIESFLDLIKGETLALEFNKVDEELELFDINGNKVGIKLEKA